MSNQQSPDEPLEIGSLSFVRTSEGLFITTRGDDGKVYRKAIEEDGGKVREMWEELQAFFAKIQPLEDKEGKTLEWDGEGYVVVDNRPAEHDGETRKRTRGPRRQLTPIVAKGKETITMTSDIVTQEIVKGLRDPSSYKVLEEVGIAEHCHLFSKEKGRLIITIKPLEDEGWQEVLAATRTLGPGCNDTFAASVAIALETNGIEHVCTSFLASPDDILEVCGKKKHNGSYSAGQRAEVIKHLKTLSQARVIATMPGPERKGTKKPGRKRKGATDDSTVIRAEGALLDLLSFKIGEYNTITGEEIWEKRSMAIGKWITMAPGLNQQTAVMLRQVLAYSAKNERYQKDLGYYLTFMIRNNNHKPGGVFEVSMKTMLEGAGIKVPREIGDFREAIEHALACLKQDNVIGDYVQVVDARTSGKEIQEVIHQHARGWWDYYAAIKWRFTPPQYAREQYKGLLKGKNDD